MKQNVIIVMLLTMLSIAITSCSDNEDVISDIDPNIKVTFAEDELVLPLSGRYYTLNVSVDNIDLSDIKVVTDADWLAISVDTIATDGIVEIFAPANYDVKGREATVDLRLLKNDRMLASCRVYQQGEGDNEYNTATADYFYIGYGYNIFAEYMSANSLCNPVLDFDKVNKYSSTYPLYQSVLRSNENVEYITANSIVQMADLLTKKMDGNSKDYKGAVKTISRFDQTGNINKADDSYTYMNFRSISASASLDISILNMLIEKGYDIFNDDFKEAYYRIVQNPTNTQYVEQLLRKYGTHLVISTELGGKMDLAVNFSRETKGELSIRAEDFANYFFKSENSDFKNSNGEIQGINSNISVNGTFTIIGGDMLARDEIEKKLKDGSSQGRVDAASLDKWLSSLECTSVTNTAQLKKLAPVNFISIPLYQLFPSTFMSSFLKIMIKMSQASNNNLNSYTQGTDYYTFPLKNASFMKFNDNADESLVRVVYASTSENTPQQPILEICNEYVPIIRGDKRINVIYGIKNGRTFHGYGIFPGDGEGNPPSILTFSDGDVYAKPITGKDIFDILDTVYYMHGNIYETSLNVQCEYPAVMTAENQFLTLENDDGKKSYPIVKIGSGYWTRKNINMFMGFESDYSSCEIMEEETNNNFYACAFAGNDEAFMWHNEKIYGSETDSYYKKPTKWYLPQTSDADNMQKYLGYNLKELMKNQAVGFDAQFCGYYGNTDYLKNVNYDYFQLRDMENCYITFKNDANSCMSLVLTPGYTFLKIPKITEKSNMFPIRLFRTSYFKYCDIIK